MRKMKMNYRRFVSLLCIFIMFVQIFIGAPGLQVFASEVAKSEFQEAIEQAIYQSTYAGAETADQALATAKTKVQEVVSGREDASEKAASVVINAGTHTLNAKGGTYTFTATVTPSDGVAFTTDTLTMNIDACPETIEVVFDKQDTVDKATVHNVIKTFVPKSGTNDKSYMQMETQNTNQQYHIYFSELCSSGTLDLDAYPYIKISYRNRSETAAWEPFSIFAKSDAYESTSVQHLLNIFPYDTADAAKNGIWNEATLNMHEKSVSYATRPNNGTYTEKKTAIWTGNSSELRLDFTDKTGRIIDIEYIAFFGSKAEAEAYPIKLGDLKSSLEKTEYTATYAQADSVAMLTPIAEQQIQAVIADWTEYTGSSASFTFGNKAELNRYVSGGSYVFNIIVTLEDQSTFETTLTLKIAPRPETKELVFDTAEKVQNAGSAPNKSFAEDGSKKYMKMTNSGNIQYGMSIQQISETGTLDLDAYRYIKVSYRHIRPEGGYLSWEVSQFYATSDAYAGSNNVLYQYTSGIAESDNNLWYTAIYDLNDKTVEIYDAAGTLKKSKTLTQKSNLWSGNASAFRFDFSVNGTFSREVDVEYIAFFGSEAQAKAYPALPDDSVDVSMQKLSNATFSCESAKASTQPDADNEIRSQLEVLNLPAACTLQNAVYVAPTTSSTGSYTVDVVFTSTGDTVTVKMTIDKTPITPVVWTFDNRSILSQFKGTNINAAYENGYVKMTVANSSSEDGFFLEGAPQSDEKFDISTLPYLKIKYKITGAQSAPMQIFYWVDNGHYYWRNINANDPEWSGDTVTVIADLSVVTTGQSAVWLENLTDEVSKTLKFATAGADAGAVLCEGNVSKVRINFARQANLERSAEIEYIGFFPSKEAAEEYEGNGQERVAKAVEYLQKQSVELRWANGKTEEKAIEGVKAALDSAGVGCTEVKNFQYKKPTSQETGSITCTAVLKSGEAKAEVEVTLTIGKEPSEPIVWRFNDSDFVNKISPSKIKMTVEENVTKIVSTDPTAEDGFYFIVNLPDDTEQFYLEDYSYIRMKYKRVGLGPGQLYYYSDALSGNPNLGQLGYGTKEGDWYTSIIDTSVRDFETPMIYNYNHRTGDTEIFKKYAAYGVNGLPTDEWHGLATAFRFNFGRRAHLDREMELEYIAFFPTLEAAQAYDAVEENERLKSNAQVALKSYSGSSVSFYEGHTEDAARDKAADIISSILGDEVAVSINKVSHVVPVKNATVGSYTFTATIKNLDGEILFTTSEYTLSISKEVDTTPIVFTFTNPEFIKRVEGTNPEAMGYACMGLSDSLATKFELDLNASEKFHLEGHPYVALKVTADAETNRIMLNDIWYELGSLDGETIVVINTETGEVYKNATKVEGLELLSIAKEKITRIGMQFADQTVNVHFIAFFSNFDEAQNYSGESLALEETLERIKSLNISCAYADAKNEQEALSYVRTKISATLGENVRLISAESTAYNAATENVEGNLTVQAIICVGNESDSHYAVANIVITIGKKPSEPVVWKFTPEFISKLSRAGNVTLSSSGNNTLLMDSVTNSEKTGFYFTASKEKVDMDFYLQDYPYIKMKYRYNSSASSTGTSLLYFANDETGTASRSYSIGKVDKNGVWCSAILDMSDNTITISDLENNLLLSESAMSGTTGYRGKPNWFRVDMGQVAGQRHVELEYIAFFSSREEAEGYNHDYAYTSHEFNGVEYATASNTLDKAPLTIESAILTSTKETMTILSNKEKDNNNYYALETTDNGAVRFVYGGQEVLVSNGKDVCDGKWHQIAVTLEDNNAVLYIDGQSVANNAGFDLNDNISIKAPVMASDYTTSSPFKGYIYYIRLYETVQNAEALTAYAFNKNITEDVLAGWFTDQVTDKEQFADVKKDNAMTLVDNYAYEGHEFLGNDYVKTEAKLNAKPQTFEFWMKGSKDMLTGCYTILSNKTDSSNGTYTAVELIEGQLRMVYNGTTLFTTEGQSFADNIWKHVAITLGDTTKLYIDGQSVNITSVPYTANDSAMDMYYIGAGLESTKTPYIGKLSDVRIWSSERTGADIKANMQDYLADASDELLSAWRLDKQSYLKYTDNSSYKNTGTLYSSGWYKLENITGDYTLGAIGDTQSYVGSSGNPALMIKLFENLSGKVDEFNMKYLFHVGDVTQNDTLMEWGYARQAYDFIEGKVPYSIILGNHDYPSPSSGTGAEFRKGSKMNDVFPVSTYEAQTLSTFGGVYEENDPTNMYMFFEVGDVEYMVFSIEYGPRDEILEWVGKVCDRYPEKTAIVLTHAYFAYGGKGEYEWGDFWTNQSLLDSAGEEFHDGNAGQQIWDKLLSKHSNIALLLCGHSQNPFIVSRETEGDYGNNVVQMMVDHSAVAHAFPSQEGVMTLLAIDEETGAMHTYWYSALYDAYYCTDNEQTFDMSDNLVKKDRKAYFSDEEYKLEDYRSGDTFTYPDAEKAGYIFAGWFDAETKQPIATTTTEGTAIAKFVDADVLSVKFQAGLVEQDSEFVIPETNAKIRFVTTVDSLDYADIAFTISTERADGSFTTPKSTSSNEARTKVYEKLYYIGDDSGEVMDYSPKLFSPYSQFFKAYTLHSIPASAYDTDIRVTPYWVTLDGTTVEGKQRTVCVNDIIKGYAEK